MEDLDNMKLTNTRLVDLFPADSVETEAANSAILTGVANTPEDPLKRDPENYCNKFQNMSETTSADVSKVGEQNPLVSTEVDPLQLSNVGSSTPGSQRKGLRVTFPEDKVVSGYMDPPTPWNDASLCSTDELVVAYLNACEKVGVKPNARLLNQLQVITNFDDRNETLTLKNEHLDAKHCETLEEVFRRVQFRTIDLEATKLEEEGAVTIFDMIEYYESCLKLNISYSKNLGQRGWQACSRMIRKTPCLENLEARGSALSDFVMPFLGRSLRVSSSLLSLHLEFTVTSGKPLQILVAALKVNETLKELYLADNKLMPSDGIQLGSLLKYNRTLQLLDLRNNHLQDTGFLHLCEGIWEQGKGSGLNTMVVWNNQLSYQAMNHLAKALLNSTSLETINLGHNNLTNEGMHRLKDSLLKNKSLLRIGLQASKISCEGAVALAEFIAESLKLVRLDLRENDIKTGGLMALCLALKVSSSVTRIDLDKDPKKESGVKDFAEQQRRLLNDITNYMQRNRTMARQREEDEIAHENEINLIASAGTDANFTDELVVKEKETASNDLDLVTPEMKTECEKCTEEEEPLEKMKEPSFSAESPRHRMNLTLELNQRCQMLESPDFVSEAEMSTAALPPNEVMAETTDVAAGRVPKRKILIDIPPSPMVSSQGKTVLVPVFEGSLSLGLDDAMISTNETSPVKAEDIVLSSDPGTLSNLVTIIGQNESFSLASAFQLSGFQETSPLSAVESVVISSGPEGSYSSPSNVADSPSSVQANHSSALANIPHTKWHHQKSNLKMTRPKHRFQVHKSSLSHKPIGRRGSDSHKTFPFVTDQVNKSTSEHSEVKDNNTSCTETASVTAAHSHSSGNDNNCPEDSDVSEKCSPSDAVKTSEEFMFNSDEQVSNDDSINRFDLASTPLKNNEETSNLGSWQNIADEADISTNAITKTLDFPVSSFPLVDAEMHEGLCVNRAEETQQLDSLTDAILTSLCENPGETYIAGTNHALPELATMLLGMRMEDNSPGQSDITGTVEAKPITSVALHGCQNTQTSDVQNMSLNLPCADTVEADSAEAHEVKHFKAQATLPRDQCENAGSINEKSMCSSNGLMLGFSHDVIETTSFSEDAKKLHVEMTTNNCDEHSNAKKSLF